MTSEEPREARPEEPRGTYAEEPREAYVWIWLPGAEEPVVAGRLEATGDIVDFNYGRSYLARADAIALYEPELPLRAGRMAPLPGLRIPGCTSSWSSASTGYGERAPAARWYRPDDPGAGRAGGTLREL